METLKLEELMRSTLLELSTDDGILASGREEIFGCTFGRDTAITVLEMLKVHERKPDNAFIDIARRALLGLARLQGKRINVESGEQPGKFIHEFRKDRYEHLSKAPKPWYVYPEGVLKNYDSIDSTPLALIAMHRFWDMTKDAAFLETILPSVELGLGWIIAFGDLNGDYLLEYAIEPVRAGGGLPVQSWTDSMESLIRADGSFPKYPIAPVEVQAYAWLALRLWAGFFAERSPYFARRLGLHSECLRKAFNERFIMRERDLYFAGQAIDGDNMLIRTITANPMLCLWAAVHEGGGAESIVDDRYLKDFVKRAFMEDLFDPEAGFRTMSMLSPTYNPREDSYHNGSSWPVLNGMAHEGLLNFGYYGEAQLLKEGSIKPIQHFGSAIELYMRGTDGSYAPFRSSSGQESCRTQAWSAAAILAMMLA